MTYDYDLFVIGGGSGGVRAARMAAREGARVGIAEEYRYGGTCVIRGCVPKKLFVYASHFRDEFDDAHGYGWTTGPASFDWPALRDNVQREVSRLSGIYIDVLDKAGAEHFQSRAVLEDARTVRLLAENRALTAKTILIATGSAPFIPHIHGREHIVSSNEMFLLEKLPDRLAIVGGGYIGVEFACIMNGLGVDVALIYRGGKILNGFDEDLRDGLMEAMWARGVKLMLNKYLARIDEADGEKLIAFEDGGEMRADCVMYATGRVPLTADMGLMEAGVKLGLDGEILVNDFSQSSVENIYAVGDVTDRVNLTPVAIREAMCFVDTVFKGKPTPMDYGTIPTAVFSQPEIGTVGLTEAQAREQYGAIDIYKSRFRPMKYILPGREERMMMKLVVNAHNGIVLGCHILGPGAAEMAQLLAIPMRLGARKADFDATMALHPSAAEELVTMREKWMPPQG
jgi:glutathione reductase (NADPH)